MVPALDRTEFTAGVRIVIRFSTVLTYFERVYGICNREGIAQLQHGQQIFRLPNKLGRRTEGHTVAHAGMEEWADEPDMLTTKQAADLTGYNDTTINNWAADGKIQAVNYYGKNLISKESLAEYLVSPEGQRIARHSQKHQELMESYMNREQNSGMVFGSMSL